MEAKRYDSLDLLKWAMSVVVIAQHTRPFEGVENLFFERWETMFFSLSVPCFFLCSGFFLFREREESREETVRRVRRYALNALRLYLLWTAVYLPCTFYGYFTDGKSFWVDLYLLVQGTVLGGYHFCSWHLWYLLSVFYGGGLLYLLIKHNWSEKAIFAAALFLFFVGVAMSDLVEFPCSLPVLSLIRTGIVRTFESGRIFTAPLYLVLGGWLSRKKVLPPVKGTMLILAAAFLAGMLRIPIWSGFMTVFAAVGIFCLTLSVSLKPSPVWRYFDRASKINYYWHMMFVFVYTLCFREFAYYGWDVFLAAAVCCLAVSLLPTVKDFAVKKKGKDI